ncbi:MAG: AEC family transporter [Bifidobacterium subtile]|jgi:predicted permease|nr:AEC family transporter [Bifidobacterium subtile]MCI1241767.1 AEC family transporter [Bifidobacterium subtile]MCI1258496.1 AEC family transporter [Bifidobacterium subtile]
MLISIPQLDHPDWPEERKIVSFTQLATQIALVFCLMFFGVFIRRSGHLHQATANDLTDMLLYYISPLVIIRAFQQPFSSSGLHVLSATAAAVVTACLISIVLSKLLFMRVKDPAKQRAAKFGSVYSNAGFMGIPLAQALFGSAGVFYAVVSLAVFNIFAWTHGTSLYQGPHSKNGWRAKAKAIIVNPNIAAILIGLAMFVLSIHLPSQINQFLTYVSDLFTPLSMIVIGSSLVDIPLRSVTFDLPIMISLLLRNLFYPVIAILMLKLFAVTGTAFTTSVILSSCPAAGMVVLFAMRNGDDTKPGVMLMSLSTILSLLTIPLVYLLSTII